MCCHLLLQALSTSQGVQLWLLCTQDMLAPTSQHTSQHAHTKLSIALC